METVGATRPDREDASSQSTTHKANFGVAPSVLLVDDEDLVRWSLRHRLSADGCVIREAATGAQARAELAQPFDLVLLDYRLPDADGLTLLREIRARIPTRSSSCSPRTPACSARSRRWPRARSISCPSRSTSTTSRSWCTARSRPRSCSARSARCSRAIPTRRSASPLLGESPPMLEVKRLVRRFAQSRASTVLITGETGVGKDVAARALHAVSDRADKPFTNITCSALPDSLLESELFGYERGAFTDARQRKIGLLEQADGGTVFLDEIGEMALGLQAKLLRFLEEKAFRRVGGSDDIRPDVRVVAATNRDLLDAVRDGRFREDLYYRIAVLQIPIPPLRERGDDIDLLGAFFVDRFNRAFHKRVRGISRAAIAAARGVRLAGQRARASQRDRARDAADRERRAGVVGPALGRRAGRAAEAARAGHAAAGRRDRSRWSGAQPGRTSVAAHRRQQDARRRAAADDTRSNSLPRGEVSLRSRSVAEAAARPDRASPLSHQVQLQPQPRGCTQMRGAFSTAQPCQRLAAWRHGMTCARP